MQIWSPVSLFSALPFGRFTKKWLGYIDQYVVFIISTRLRLKKCNPNTLFVFTDQALGPWVSLVINKPHVIHCHDFLALQSAIGEIPENKTSWTGKTYQLLIHKGYSQSENFISVSKNTRQQLSRFLSTEPRYSEVVYNGLKEIFKPRDPHSSRELLKSITGLELMGGYILHTGGNQWYKNRSGVIEIYNAWRAINKLSLPLLLIGAQPSAQLIKMYSLSPFKNDIYITSGRSDEFVAYAYAGASVFLFPSLAEGFGWPIAEAMACGCPVITTNEAPMTEVAGNAGFLIPRRPYAAHKAEEWSIQAARVLNAILQFTKEKREKIAQLGIKNAERFNSVTSLDYIESIYTNILQHQKI